MKQIIITLAVIAALAGCTKEDEPVRTSFPVVPAKPRHPAPKTKADTDTTLVAPADTTKKNPKRGINIVPHHVYTPIIFA